MVQIFLISSLLIASPFFAFPSFSEEKELASGAPQEQSLIPVYSLKQVVELTKRKNFQIRSQAEKLHQAQKAINIAKGKMIPRLNLAVGMAGVVSDFSTIASSMIGFAFPDNWFRFKGTKSIYQAEQLSYLAMIANQINGVVAIYYQAQLLKQNIAITEFYIEKARDILAYVDQMPNRAESWLYQRAKFANFRILLMQDHETLTKTLAEFYRNLAFASGIENNIQNSFEIDNFEYIESDQVSPLKIHDCLTRALRSSLEIQQLTYLIEAAQKETHSRKFEFLNPLGNSESSLGYGYKSYIKIGKSQLRELIIKQEETFANLRMSCQQTVTDFNSSLISFELANDGLRFSEQQIIHVYRQLQQIGEFDAGDFIDAFSEELSFAMNKAVAIYNQVLAKAQYDRLTLAAPFYHNIALLIPDDSASKCCCL